MANVVVVGAQWGDEGKGKIVDWLSERADVIARFQGGHNAGHTLVIGGTVYKLSLLPSGVVRPGKLSVIGNGVVLDPWALIAEIERHRRDGRRGHARDADDRRERAADPAGASRARRAARGGGGRGQDRHDRARHRAGLRGQGRAARRPASPISATRRRWTPGSTGCSRITTRCAAASGQPEIDRAGAERPACSRSRRGCCPSPGPSGRCSTRVGAQGDRILFEGAQGALLDVDFGTYPFVTSSNTMAGHGGDGHGHGAGRHRLRARHRQGLHDPRRPGPVPDRADRRRSASASASAGASSAR